ncbi:MAG: hypothetical protein ABJZ55_04350 [Fuerstiella sp.]
MTDSLLLESSRNRPARSSLIPLIPMVHLSGDLRCEWASTTRMNWKPSISPRLMYFVSGPRSLTATTLSGPTAIPIPNKILCNTTDNQAMNAEWPTARFQIEAQPRPPGFRSRYTASIGTGSHSMTTYTRWAFFAFIALLLIAATASLRLAANPSAEAAAILHVELNGFCTGGDSLSAISSVADQITGAPVTVRPKTVGFPRDRMDDEMVGRLLSIHGLGAIMLFPPDTDNRGYDTLATSISTLDTLRDLDLPASAKSLTKLEQQHPKLIFLAADRPGTNVATDQQMGLPK